MRFHLQPIHPSAYTSFRGSLSTTIYRLSIENRKSKNRKSNLPCFQCIPWLISTHNPQRTTRSIVNRKCLPTIHCQLPTISLSKRKGFCFSLAARVFNAKNAKCTQGTQRFYKATSGKLHMSQPLRPLRSLCALCVKILPCIPWLNLNAQRPTLNSRNRKSQITTHYPLPSTHYPPLEAERIPLLP